MLGNGVTRMCPQSQRISWIGPQSTVYRAFTRLEVEAPALQMIYSWRKNKMPGAPFAVLYSYTVIEENFLTLRWIATVTAFPSYSSHL
jgi:hypothetical protein